MKTAVLSCLFLLTIPTVGLCQKAEQSKEPKEPAARTFQEADRLKDPNVRGIDDLKAFFLKGLTSKSNKLSVGPRRPNKIYTVGELKRKFGEPTSRNGGTNESWLYNCRDGQCYVHFRTKGYSQSNVKEDALRLEIFDVSIIRKNEGDGGGKKGKPQPRPEWQEPDGK